MNEETIKKKNMKVKGKCPIGRLRSRWEQHVRKAVTQKEGKAWEETEEELQEERDRWRGLVVRQPTKSRNILRRKIRIRMVRSGKCTNLKCDLNP
jgi:hypothetical protein